MNLKKYFHRKKIVHTTKWHPGVLIKTFEAKGQKWLRIGFENRQRFNGMLPVTDVPFTEVTGIRRLPSRFEKAFWRLLGLKAKGKFFIINRKKEE